MNSDAVTALVSSFVGGFLLTWVRGYKWFGDGATSALALGGGVLCAWMLGAHTPMGWGAAIMEHTLTVFGAVHVGGMAANARGATTLPAAAMPKFNELSHP